MKRIGKKSLLLTLQKGGMLTSLLFASACLFTSVGEDLEQDSCLEQAASFCGELNQLEPTGDECLAWRCDMAEGVCKILPLDADGDGLPAEACAPAGSLFDCDDSNPNRRPSDELVSVAESCDGVDNDCDGIVDEAAYRLSSASELFQGLAIRNFSVSTDENFSESFAFTVGSDSSNLSTAGAGDTAGSQPKFFAIGDKETVTFESPLARSIARLHFPGVGDLLAFAFGDLPNDLALGIVGSEGISGIRTSLLADAPASVDVSDISLAKDQASNRFALGYLERDPAPTDFCSELSPAVSVKFLTGTISGGTPGLNQEFVVGETSDPSAPGLVSLGEEKWALAHSLPQDAGVALYLLNTANLSDRPKPTLVVNSTSTAGEVSVSVSDDMTRLALAFRDGCANNARPKVAIVNLEESASLERVVELSGAQQSGQPRVWWRESPSEGWNLTWQEGSSEVKLATLLADGSGMGENYSLLSLGEGSLRQGGQLLPHSDQGWEAYIASESGLHTLSVECSLED